jgi:hypothetical protein
VGLEIRLEVASDQALHDERIRANEPVAQRFIRYPRDPGQGEVAEGPQPAVQLRYHDHDPSDAHSIGVAMMTGEKASAWMRWKSFACPVR